MTSSEVRQVFLPYCLQRLSDGRYILLNRRYKPLGTHAGEWVDYDKHPSAFRFKRSLSGRQAALLSWEGSEDTEVVFFYDDGCIPTHGAAKWTAYSKRLERLAGYDIEG